MADRARLDELIERIDELTEPDITELVDDSLQRGQHAGLYHPPGEPPYPIPEPKTPDLLGLVLHGVTATLRAIGWKRS